MSHKIITIARQFGSGGHEVAQRLSDQLGIPLYDRNLVEMAAERMGHSPVSIEKADESALSSFLAGYQIPKEPNSVTGYGLSLNDSTYVTQTIIIEALAQKGPCVIVGRCGDYVLRSHPDLTEGDLTRIRAALVCEGSLVEVAQCLELGAYLKLGKGEEAGGGRERPSIIADAVEAVLAAVYLDGGIGSARKLIQKFILDREAEKSASRDYKTALQELVQRESGQVLGYQLIGAEGPDHAKIFSVEVDLNGIPIGQGRGRSKKEAEQNAAKAAIEKLKAGE